MNLTERSRGLSRACVAALAGAAVLMAGAPVLAGDTARSVNERVAAEPNGTVEIVDVAGKITLAAWDRPEVAVTGTIGPQIERVSVTRDGARVTVRVQAPRTMVWGRDAGVTLTVYAPRASAANVQLVSADLTVAGLTGFEELRTVSGNVVGEVGGAAKVHTVSGDVDLEAPDRGRFEAQTVSGNVRLHSAGDQVEIATVSGDVTLQLGTFSHARIDSVSGDLRLTGAVASGGDLSAQAISGNLKIDLAESAAGSYDVKTMSGDITNCFGPKATRPAYGPGARAMFREGDGSARIALETKSGDVHLCNRATLAPAPKPVSATSQAPERMSPRTSTIVL